MFFHSRAQHCPPQWENQNMSSESGNTIRSLKLVSSWKSKVFTKNSQWHKNSWISAMDIFEWLRWSSLERSIYVNCDKCSLAKKKKLKSFPIPQGKFRLFPWIKIFIYNSFVNILYVKTHHCMISHLYYHHYFRLSSLVPSPNLSGSTQVWSSWN